MKKIYIKLIISFTVLLVLLTGIVYAEETTAEVLACELNNDGWVLYGTDQCPWCIKQKEEFGDSFTNLTYINCKENMQVCIDAGIESIPSWVSPNGTFHPGYHNLTKLNEIMEDYRAEHSDPSANNDIAGFGLMYSLIAILIVLLIRRR